MAKNEYQVEIKVTPDKDSIKEAQKVFEYTMGQKKWVNHRTGESGTSAAISSRAFTGLKRPFAEGYIQDGEMLSVQDLTRIFQQNASPKKGVNKNPQAIVSAFLAQFKKDSANIDIQYEDEIDPETEEIITKVVVSEIESLKSRFAASMQKAAAKNMNDAIGKAMGNVAQTYLVQSKKQLAKAREDIRWNKEIMTEAGDMASLPTAVIERNKTRRAANDKKNAGYQENLYTEYELELDKRYEREAKKVGKNASLSQLAQEIRNKKIEIPDEASNFNDEQIGNMIKNIVRFLKQGEVLSGVKRIDGVLTGETAGIYEDLKAISSFVSNNKELDKFLSFNKKTPEELEQLTEELPQFLELLQQQLINYADENRGKMQERTYVQLRNRVIEISKILGSMDATAEKTRAESGTLSSLMSQTFFNQTQPHVPFGGKKTYAADAKRATLAKQGVVVGGSYPIADIPQFLKNALPFFPRKKENEFDNPTINDTFFELIKKIQALKEKQDIIYSDTGKEDDVINEQIETLLEWLSIIFNGLDGAEKDMASRDLRGARMRQLANGKIKNIGDFTSEDYKGLIEATSESIQNLDVQGKELQQAIVFLRTLKNEMLSTGKFSKEGKIEQDLQDTEEAIELRAVLNEFKDRDKWYDSDFEDLGLTEQFGTGVSQFSTYTDDNGQLYTTRESISEGIAKLLSDSLPNNFDSMKEQVDQAIVQAEEAYLKEQLIPYIEDYLSATNNAQKGATSKQIKANLGENAYKYFQDNKKELLSYVSGIQKRQEEDNQLPKSPDFVNSFKPKEVSSSSILDNSKVEEEVKEIEETKETVQALTEEKRATEELNQELQEHETAVQGAVEAESQKILVSGKLSDALLVEKQALNDVNEAATSESNSRGKNDIDLEGFIPNFDEGKHQYSDDSGESFYSVTQLRDYLIRAQNPAFASDLARLTNAAQNSTGQITADSMGMLENDFKFMTQGVIGQGLRGDLFHSLIDKMVTSGSTTLAELEQNDKAAFEEYQKQYQETVKALAKYGIGEEFLGIEGRLESYMDAMQKSGMTATEFSEQRLAFSLDGDRGKVKIGVTPDQLYSQDGVGAFIDNKTGSVKGFEAFQLTGQYLGTIANQEAFSDQLKEIDLSQPMKAYIAEVKDDSTRLIEYQMLSLREFYDLAIDAVEIANGNKSHLTKDEVKERMNRQMKTGSFFGVSEQAQSSSEIVGYASGSKEENSVISKYISKQKELLEVEQKLFALERERERLIASNASSAEITRVNEETKAWEANYAAIERTMEKMEEVEVESNGTTSRKVKIGDVLLSDTGTSRFDNEMDVLYTKQVARASSDARKDRKQLASKQEDSLKYSISLYEEQIKKQNEIYEWEKKIVGLSGTKRLEAEKHVANLREQLSATGDLISQEEISKNINEANLLTEEQRLLLQDKLTQAVNQGVNKKSELDIKYANSAGNNSVEVKGLTTRYLENLKKQGQIDREIRRAELSGQGLTGTKATENAAYVNTLKRQKSQLESDLPRYDAQKRTLNDIELTEEEINKLERERTNILQNNDAQMDKINTSVGQTKGLFERMGENFRESFNQIGNALLAFVSFDTIKRGFDAFIRSTEELDRCMVDLQIASGYTRKEISAMMLDFNDLAKSVGKSTQEVAIAANDWLRAGYAGQEATQLTEASMQLSTLGMIESSEATSYLISVLKGWKLEANEVAEVVDKLTAVDMSAAISAGDLAEAMSRANNSAQLAGSTMDKYIGYITTVSDVTQKSASSIGESFKTLYSRYQNVAAGKFVAAQEDIESENYNEDEWSNLNDVEKSLGALGINIRESVDSFRSFDDVLEEIASKWDTFTDVQQSGIATSMAGTRQRENFVTLMENWGAVEQYEKIAENSYGTAIEKMKAYTDSVDAAKERLTAAVEEWVLKLNQSDTIKWFYNSLAEVVDNLHLLIPALGAFLVVMNRASLFNLAQTGMGKIFSTFANISGFLERQKITGLGYNARGWTNIKDNIKGQFETAQKQTYAKALTNQIAAMEGYTEQQKAAMTQGYTMMQTQLIGLEAAKQKNITDLLLKDLTVQEADQALRDLAEDERSILIQGLLNSVTEQEYQTVMQRVQDNWKKLHQGEELTQSELELQMASELLANKRRQVANQTVVGNVNQAGQTSSKAAIIKGASSLAGALIGSSGGSGWGNIIGSAIGGKEGASTGKTIGSMAGGAIGTWAMGAITGGATGAKLGGAWGAIAGLIIGAVWSGIKTIKEKQKEKAREEAQESFKETVDKYSSAKGLVGVAERYEKLAAGVDSLGNNVSLTNEEYEEFLSCSNQLVETFPQLLSFTDKEGNSIAFMGDSAESTSDKVAGLVKDLEDLANLKMVDKDVLEPQLENAATKYQTAADNLGQLQKEAGDVFAQKLAAEERVKSLEIANSSSSARHDVSSNDFGLNAVDLLFKQVGYEAGDIKYNISDKAYSFLQKYADAVRQNHMYFFAANSKNEEDFVKQMTEAGLYDYIETTYKNLGVNSYSEINSDVAFEMANTALNNAEIARHDFIIALDENDYDFSVSEEEVQRAQKNLEELTKAYETAEGKMKAANGALSAELDSINKDMAAYGVAYAKTIGAFNGISEDMAIILTQALNGINAVKINEDKIESYTAEEYQKKVEEIIGNINNIFAGDTELIEIALGVDEAKTQEEYLQAMEKLKAALLEEFLSDDGTIDNDEINILEIFGLSVTYDTSMSPMVEVATNWYEDLKKNYGNLTMSEEWFNNLGKEDAKKVHSWYNAGWLTAESDEALINQMLSTNRDKSSYLPIQSERLVGELDNLDNYGSELSRRIADFFTNEDGTFDFDKTRSEIASEFGDLPLTVLSAIEDNAETLKKDGVAAMEDAIEATVSVAKDAKLQEVANWAALQAKQFLPSVEFEGLIDSYSELADAFNAVNDSYNALKEARKEQNASNKLSLETVLGLLSSNAAYAEVLESTTEGIKLKGNAEEIMMKIQLQAIASNLEASIALKKEEALKLQAKIADLKATNSYTQAASAEVDAMNAEMQAVTTLTNYFLGLADAKALAAKNDGGGGSGAWVASSKATFNPIEGEVFTFSDEQVQAEITRLTDELFRLIGEVELDENGIPVLGEDGWFKPVLNEDGTFNSGQIGIDQHLLDSVYQMLNDPSAWDKFYSAAENSAEAVENLLDAMEALIDKEWEAMAAFEKNEYTQYFTKMQDHLKAKLSHYNNLLKDSTLTQAEIYEIEQKIIETQKALNNLDDEEIEDQKSLLELKGVSIETMIDIQKQLLETADTEEERVQRQKELNDLVMEELELRQDVNKWQRSLTDRQLDRLSGDAYGNAAYDIAIDEKLNSIQEDIAIQKQRIAQAYEQAVNGYLNDENNSYTLAEAQRLAYEGNSKASQLLRDLITALYELEDELVDTKFDSIEAKADDLQRQIDLIEKSRPKEWFNIEDIDKSFASQIALLQQQISHYEKALLDTSGMTDEQVQNLIDSLNDAKIALHEAQIEQLEAKEEVYNRQYDAVVTQIEMYKEEIQRAMEEIEATYEDELNKLQEQNEERERAIQLEDLLAAKRRANQEKERVYREGIGWVYESNRTSQKEAQNDLDSFLNEDRINDLTGTKDAELSILQEQLDAWDKYLEQLDWDMTEHERIQNTRILQELMGATTEAEIRQMLLDDMVRFNADLETNFRNFNTIFEDILIGPFTENMLALQALYEKALDLTSPNKYSGSGYNSGYSSGGSFNGDYTFSGQTNYNGRDYHYSAFDNRDDVDYTTLAMSAGSYEELEHYLEQRALKAERLGIDISGNGQWKSNEQLREEWSRTGAESIKRPDYMTNLELLEAYRQWEYDNNPTYIKVNKDGNTVTVDLASLSGGQLLEWYSHHKSPLEEEAQYLMDEINKQLGTNYTYEQLYNLYKDQWDTNITDDASYNSENMNRAYSAARAALGASASMEDIFKYIQENGYASGIENGPVTYTGLAMLHGSPERPEYVLNSDQAYTLLRNMATTKLPEYKRLGPDSSGGVSYVVEGNVVLEGVNDPAEFWNSVTNAMTNRWNVTKNQR